MGTRSPVRASTVRRAWIQERMEGPAPELERRPIVDRLIRATMFEQLLQTRYLGNKRFSLEGLEALIPLLVDMLETAGGHQAEMAVLAMSHRGRLNVMAHIVGTEYTDLFSGFEDVDPRSIMGAGDVKYHLGATGDFETRDGRSIGIHLTSNPSHLEAVNPVMMGRTRAKQDRLGGDDARRRIVPILMHGDAAFAGQGVTAETLNLASIEGFAVGGTIHVIVNNLIGFTAEPLALHSSRFASDLARRLNCADDNIEGRSSVPPTAASGLEQSGCPTRTARTRIKARSPGNRLRPAPSSRAM